MQRYGGLVPTRFGAFVSLGSSVDLTTQRLLEPIEGMHRAIAKRSLSLLGDIGHPLKAAHDTMLDLVYGSIRTIAVVLGVGLDHVKVAPSTDDTIRAVANGITGDNLGRHRKRLGISMSLRDSAGAPVAIGPDLAAAYPEAAGRIVVLVHGLAETHRCWHGTSQDPGLLETLQTHPGVDPLPITYNTGLRISANGEQLATLLEQLHDQWPVPVDSIALVGHSMGGLVIRAACAAAGEAGHAWITHVTDVVTVGSPHRGAPLEKLTNVASWALNAVPETRPLANFLNRRSLGIKDLRFGSIAQQDWKGVDPDALLINSVGDHSLPADIDHHFVAGVVTTDPNHPVGIAMGDLMVRTASATGRATLEPTSTVVVGGTQHFDLVSQPAVVDQIVEWLDARAHAGR